MNTAWDAYIAGGEPTALAAGDAAVPDAGVVYQIALQDPLVVVNVDVTAATAGANAFFLEHGAAEITTALANPAGAVLAAGAQEGAVAEDADGEEEEEDESRTATGSQWGNALAASFIVSLCRYILRGWRTGRSCRYIVLCLCAMSDVRTYICCTRHRVQVSSPCTKSSVLSEGKRCGRLRHATSLLQPHGVCRCAAMAHMHEWGARKVASL